MQPSSGLVTALNRMREMSVQNGGIYHQYIPSLTPDMAIGSFAQPMLDNDSLAQDLRNEFTGLLKRIVETMVYNKIYKNPLADLEGENIPLGAFVEDINIQPIKGREFNVNDFAGLLQKYEADVRAQFYAVNSDKQYPVTITRAKIKNAFTSWRTLEDFITGITNALYNGAYMEMYNQTKMLITDAFLSNKITTVQVSAVTDASTATALVKELRRYYKKFQFASTEFNAWNKLDEKRRNFQAWSNPEDIVVLLPADVDTEVSVEVLAKAFNMKETDLMGRVIVLDDFKVRTNEGEIAQDGSAIQAVIVDKGFFKIRPQDFEMDEFYNPNNRTWQYYLNVVKMYAMSVWHNAVVFATSLPTVEATAVTTESTELSVGAEETVKTLIKLTPVNATSTVTVASSDADVATAEVDGNYVKVTGVAQGTATITVTAEQGVTSTIAVTVTE